MHFVSNGSQRNGIFLVLGNHNKKKRGDGGEKRGKEERREEEEERRKERGRMEDKILLNLNKYVVAKN